MAKLEALTTHVKLDDVPRIAADIVAGKVRGRVVVDVSLNAAGLSMADWTIPQVIAMLKFHFDTNIVVTPPGTAHVFDLSRA